jgi:hypothetical protein
VCPLALGPAASARGAIYDAQAEVEVSAGHDDNMLLASGAQVGALTRTGGAYAGVDPTLAVGVHAAGYALALTYFGDLRAGADVGRLTWQQLGLEGRSRGFGPLRLSAQGFAGRFDASTFSDEGYRFAGGEAAARVTLPAWRLLLRYRAEARWLGGGARDLFHGGEVRVVGDAGSWLELGARASAFQAVPTDAAVPRFARAKVGVDATGDWGAWSAMAAASAGVAGFPGARETLVGGRAELRWAFAAHAGMVAAFDLTAVTAGPTSDYARRVASLGMWVAGDVRSSPARPVVTDVSPRVEGGQVRFRVAAPGAGSVRVVGSWNDWGAPGVALRATREPGLWEGFVALASGSHRYHFVVDGRAERPPGAARYAPDGFGSEDGVIDVEAREPTP